MSQLDVFVSQRWAGYGALALVIFCNAAGNVLLKIGATAPKPSVLPVVQLPWQTLAGIACFGFAVLIYSWALGKFDLHVAQIVVSLQYVVVIVLAVFVLGETINLRTWFGIGFIAFGLLLCYR